MKHWTELNLEDVRYTVSTTPRKYNKAQYLNIESAFDIETTSMTIDGQKTGFMYIWMMGIGHGHDVYYGRTWEEFQEFIGNVSKHLNLSKNRRLIVYSHNLSYEFQFMRKYFEWDDNFNLDERKPIKAMTVSGVEFRDSYILTGYSLEDTARNLTTHKVEKLVGNLDYNKIRHHETPLTDKEMAYCRNDIEVLTAYINEELVIHGGNITKVPLTNTGRVRKFVRDRVYYTDRDHSKSDWRKYSNYRKLMEELALTPKEYYLHKQAFQGGFVHANPTWVEQVSEDVTGIDFVSSYPGVMLAEQFPMGKGTEVHITSLAQLKSLMEEFCVVFRVRFTGLKSKIIHENYLSESKCENVVKPIINNGRIYSADSLDTTITDVDFKIIEQAYTYENIQVADVIYYPKAYLPKDFIEAIIDLYKDKTELKGVPGRETDYNHSKGMLNSTFGMTVTDIVRARVEYKDGWITNFPVVKEQIRAYNERKSRFLFYPWGVWVTAYARRNLWSGILALGDDYLYSDTDGIKLTNYDDHKDYIDGYNKVNKWKLERMCESYRIDPKRLSPKTKEGERVTIGAWDFDGYYEKFKTLGAKRYLVQEGNDVSVTVAGVGKRTAKDYMLKQCDGDIDKVFEMFNNSLAIPPEYSGNMTHTYIDHEAEFEVKDYTGNIATVNTKSGIHLESVEFSLNIADAYIAFIDNFRNGYAYGGTGTYND